MDGKLPEHILSGVSRNDDLERAGRLDIGDVVERRFGNIGLASLERRQARLRLRNDRDDEAVHVGRPLVLGELAEIFVGRVSLQNDLVALGPRDELPRPGSDCAVVPNPGAPLFDLQMIDEKLSARNGMSATKGVFSVILIVNGSTTVALSICPQLALVTLGLLSSKARSMVYLTSLASSGEPSWHFTPCGA